MGSFSLGEVDLLGDCRGFESRMCPNLLRSGLPGGCLGSKRGEEVLAAQK